MNKAKAFAALGGTVTSAAQEIGCSHQALSKAPDPLPRRIADRVLAAVARRELPSERLKELGVDVREKPAEEREEVSHG